MPRIEYVCGYCSMLRSTDALHECGATQSQRDFLDGCRASGANIMAANAMVLSIAANVLKGRPGDAASSCLDVGVERDTRPAKPCCNRIAGGWCLLPVAHSGPCGPSGGGITRDNRPTIATLAKLAKDQP